MSDRSSPGSATGTGFGRVLVAAYAIFALAASARSITQLLTKAEEAPVAYTLSAVAGVVYIVATWALATARRTLASTTIGFELAGVIAVGIASVADGALFPDETVWSDFGRGYAFVPLVLPFVGLWWLRHTAEPASGHA